ncbi:MAG: hypothetical protein ABIX28_20230 [Vicinamibacterales bacterium]
MSTAIIAVFIGAMFGLGIAYEDPPIGIGLFIGLIAICLLPLAFVVAIAGTVANIKRLRSNRTSRSLGHLAVTVWGSILTLAGTALFGGICYAIMFR